MLFDAPPPLLGIKLGLIDFSAQKRGRSPLVIPPHNPVEFFLRFDGVNDYIDIPNPSYDFSSSDEMTIIGRINTTTAVGPIFHCWSPNVFTIEVGGGGTYHFVVHWEDVTNTDWDTIQPVKTGWHHIAFVLKNGIMYFYLDGVFVVSYNTNKGAITPNTSKIYFYKRTDAETYKAGDLAELRIYNIALSATEIEQDHQRNITRTGLIGEWLLNKDVKDSVGNNHGTLYGATYVPIKRYKAGEQV